MTTSAEAFERAWGSHVRGGAEPDVPQVRELVAVAEGLRSFQTAVQAPAPGPAWVRLSEALDGPAGASVVVPLRRRPRRRLVLRLAASAVAVFAVLATVSLRATPGSFLYPLRTGLEKTALLLSPSDGTLHVHVAEARLGDLVHALRDGPEAAAPGLARSLVAERSAARAEGASVADLDADIRSDVPAALREAPTAIASEVEAILGGLLPTLGHPHADPSTEVPAGDPSGGATGGTTSVRGPGSSGPSDTGDSGSSGPGTTGGSSGSGNESSGTGDQSGDGGSSTGGSSPIDGGGSDQGGATASGGGQDGNGSGTDTSGSDGGSSGDGGSGATANGVNEGSGGGNSD